jgi:glucosamine--fructose-6-phosphate aminotransferase (isomerizing)
MNDAEILFENILSIGEHATWQNCIDHVEDGLHAWLIGTGRVKFSRVYIVGCGTSYYAAQVGKYFIEHLTHLPVEAHQAFAFSLYTDRTLLTPETLVIGISTTGNTDAVCNALEFARACGAFTLAFSAEPGSRITEIAQTTILTGGRVTIAVKTETYLQSLLCLYLFALKIAEQFDRITPAVAEYWHDQIHRAEETTSRFFENQQHEILELVDRFSSTEMVFVIGTGPNFGTAEEASLKVVEIAKMYSISKEMEDFYHGYDRELNEASPVFFIAPHGRAEKRMLDFLTFNFKVGVPSIVLSCKENSAAKQLANQVILLQSEIDELTTPLVSIAPFYLFSYHMAVKRGYDPSARRFPGVVALKTYYPE